MLSPQSLKNNHEQYEKFGSRTNKKSYFAYDYRHTDGELFTCIKPTLEQCRAAKSEWLKRYEGGSHDKDRKNRC